MGMFGGSKSQTSSTNQSTSDSSSSSSNQAYPWLQQTYGGYGGTGAAANNQLASLLGIGGDPTSAQHGFDAYKDSTGYNFTMDSGTRALNSNAAARGLYDSGATDKALVQFGQNTGQQYFQNYLAQLLGLGTQGLQGGALIQGAGNLSNSTSSAQSTGSSQGTSKTNPDLSGLIGSIISGIPKG